MSATKKYHKTSYPSIDPIRPELTAKGKTIIISGGGTGIGAEAAKCFAKANASRIAILGRRQQPLLDTKAQIEAEHPNTEILAIATDVTKKDEVEAAFAKVARNGKIDILVSNAAIIGALEYVAELSTGKFLSGIVANLQANFNLAKTFLTCAAKDGVIIETNSAAAHMTIAPRFSSYSVAKAATARFYQSLVFEHPELSVFSIHPGAVYTDMAKEAGFEPDKEGKVGISGEREGGGILGSFDDASLPASFMVWLASPEARFLKGKYLWANWDVDELKGRAKEIENSPLLSIGLVGWPVTQAE